MTDLTLKRQAFRPDGIFSVLLLDGAPRFVTLEHGYYNGPALAPLIPPGEYQCVRGVHRLSNQAPFVTYEVIGVSGHSGLLFHSGNLDRDSEGCVLLGMQFGFLGAALAVLNSRLAFAAFMDWATGRGPLTLTVLT